MLYRIQIEQRFDKKKAVIDAVKELTSDFVILSGMMYYGAHNGHRPCQIIEINCTNYKGDAIAICAEKLRKILNMPHIMVTRTDTNKVLY